MKLNLNDVFNIFRHFVLAEYNDRDAIRHLKFFWPPYGKQQLVSVEDLDNEPWSRIYLQKSKYHIQKESTQ